MFLVPCLPPMSILRGSQSPSERSSGPKTLSPQLKHQANAQRRHLGPCPLLHHSTVAHVLRDLHDDGKPYVVKPPLQSGLSRSVRDVTLRHARRSDCPALPP